MRVYTMYVGWHNNLSSQIMYKCSRILDNHLDDVARTTPQILIICPLARVAIPLRAFVSKLFAEDDVHVELHHGGRGQSINYVHFIFCSRYCGRDDQHLGIQGDFARFYVALTRARLELHNYRQGNQALWNAGLQPRAWRFEPRASSNNKPGSEAPSPYF